MTVTNPDTQSTSLPDSFTVNQAPPQPPPTLTSVSPNSGQQTQTLSVTLTGANFVGGAACNFGTGITVNFCTMNSSLQITANITITTGAVTGARSVTVSNLDGQFSTLANTFTVNVVVPGNAAYAFAEGTGLTTADLSGNGNNGTLLNGVAWTTAGKFSNALSFDGTDDNVSVPDSATLDLGTSGTIEAWVRLNAVNRWNGILAKGNANSDPVMNYALEVSDSNRFVCTLGSGNAARILTGTTAVTTATFYHVACVWNGTQLQLYINGTLNTSVTQNLTPAGNTSPLYIGQFGGNADRLRGVIDEVRIYGRALSQTEISTDMNTSILPLGPPPAVGGLNPPSGIQGQVLDVVITGSNFQNGATCSFGSGITVTSCGFNSATQLTASITITPAATVGTRTVAVTNLDGQSSSLLNGFSVNLAPTPTLTSVTPNTGVRGTAVLVTLTGTNFPATGTTVAVSGTGVTVGTVTVVNATTITATFTITAAATISARNVTVTTPGGTTGTVTFTVIGPVLTLIAPSQGPRGTSVPVTLIGSGLTGATAITVSGTGITVGGLAVVNDTTVTATLAIAATAGLTARTVSLNTTPGGTSNTVTFTVANPPAPTLSSVAPNTGVRGTAVPVTLTGTNFTATGTTMAVSGTGVTVGALTVVNSTTITATFTITAAATISARSVTVTTPGGTTGAMTFTVQGPTLASIAPNPVTPGTGVLLTLTGTNLAGATGVIVSGVGNSCTVTGPTSNTVNATCTLTTGTSNVSVTTPIGTTNILSLTVN